VGGGWAVSELLQPFGLAPLDEAPGQLRAQERADRGDYDANDDLSSLASSATEAAYGAFRCRWTASGLPAGKGSTSVSYAFRSQGPIKPPKSSQAPPPHTEHAQY
jgi:hypothetical protein